MDQRDSKRGQADVSPILAHKEYGAPSVFRPEALLREARRQRGLPLSPVPEVCLLDPDGDVVRRLRASGAAHKHAAWACYHTDLFSFDLAGVGEAGVVGCAVGAPFAVLVAEQLFASGCRLLISVTSAGQIADLGPTPYFILIDRALRDEGTSHHYLAPSTFTAAPDALLMDRVHDALAQIADVIVHRGATWTTDAPYRETDPAIAAARAAGALAVEMEASALYAFAAVRKVPVVCLAHVTNTMARSEGDFEKGEADGATSTLALVAATASAALARHAES